MQIVQRALVVAMVVAITLLTVSCGNTGRTIKVKDFESHQWSASEDFYYDNSDTLSRRDISLVVRYDKGYVADSVAMTILTVSPDSLVFEEPFTLHIPRLGNLRPEEQSFVYRSNVLLARSGRYLFRLTPLAPVEGIESIGIIVGEKQ